VTRGIASRLPRGSVAALRFGRALVLLVSLAFAATASFAAVTFRSADSASAAATAGVTYVNAGAVDSSNGGNIAPGYPAGWQAGDLLLCVVETKDNVALSMPAGWAVLSSATSGGTHQAAIFWKFAATGDNTTPTVTHSGGNTIIAQIIGFRGVDSATPFDVANSFTVSGADLTTEAGAITTVTPNTMLVFTAHMADNHTGIGAPAGSTPWTQAFFSATSSGTDASIAAYYGLRASAGNQPAVTATRTGAANAISHGAQIALRPAPDGLTINKPPGTVAGDVMIASVAVTLSTITIAPPTGWMPIREVVQGSATSSRLATFYRIAGPAEPASYTWTFSGGAHSGAVGGILTFSGVDNSTPIDDELGNATASSISHTAPAVTTTQPEAMLVTIHELTSSRTWTFPGGMTEAVDVASLAPNNASGISMEINYEARPAAGGTGTRTASAGGNADSGATQSVALRPAPLICFTDDFNRANGPPGANWVVSNSSGSFGNPVIFSNRLRLTNASGDVATLATLQRIFPGAGNRIEVEFDHFAYGGSGADGITLTFSDRAVAPVAGAYGGSLGYAQKTIAGGAPANIPGFAGGWLGVGIDEFGNFSNPTEGRITGPGFRVDSVAVRGSGAGLGGYLYHAGTAANLNPQVDNNGSASPPHRYRVIVDHSNNTNAFVSIERDTGAGYVMLVAPYDAKAQAGQAAVPTEWTLSYTGSTGGSTNIHEIDNLRICATSQFPITALDHFAINIGAASASTCSPKNITITAQDASNATVTNYTGTINITTSSNHGDWAIVTGGGVLNNGAANDGAASYTFAAGDNGVVTLALTNHHADDLTVSVVDPTLPSSLRTSATIQFRDNAFVVTVTDPLGNVPVAGRDHALNIAMWRRDPSTGNCAIATGYAGNKNLKAWLTLDPSHPGGAAAPSINGVTLPAAVPGANNLPNLNFVAGQYAFNLASTDVGKYVLNFRDDSGTFATGVAINGSSPTLTTRPFGLHATVTGNPGATTPGGAVFTAAGSDFAGTVRGVRYQSADDANGDGIPDAGADLSNNLTTASYAWTTALAAAAPYTPAAGVLGTLANGTIAPASFSGGQASPANLRYSEVGSFTLRASATDFLNTAGVSLTDNGGFVVGRFRPFDFAVAYNTPAFTTYCGTGASGFTYIGQGFTYATAPVMTVTARNAQGATTQNYGAAGGWFKLTNSTLNGRTYTAATGTLDTGGLPLPAVDPAIVNNGNGTATLTFGAGSGLAFTRSTPVAPFDAEISLAINVTDNEASFAGNPARFGTAAPGGGIAFTQSKRMVFGQLRLLNAIGSERIPLPVRMRLEYWNGTGFVVNTNDGCTTLPRSSIVMSNYQLNLAACETAFPGAPDPIPFTNGAAMPALAAPGANNNGSVDLRVELGAVAGQYCPAVGGGQAGTSSAGRSYLQGRWTGGSYDQDPTARAAFGIYGTDKTPNQFIYFRENH